MIASEGLIILWDTGPISRCNNKPGIDQKPQYKNWVESTSLLELFDNIEQQADKSQFNKINKTLTDHDFAILSDSNDLLEEERRKGTAKTFLVRNRALDDDIFLTLRGCHPDQEKNKQKFDNECKISKQNNLKTWKLILPSTNKTDICLNTEELEINLVKSLINDGCLNKYYKDLSEAIKDCKSSADVLRILKNKYQSLYILLLYSNFIDILEKPKTFSERKSKKSCLRPFTIKLNDVNIKISVNNLADARIAFLYLPYIDFFVTNDKHLGNLILQLYPQYKNKIVVKTNVPSQPLAL